MKLSRSVGPLNAWIAAGLAGLGLILGCSQGSLSSLKGQVTFEGKAVDDGNIVLRPVEKTPGPGAAVKVTGGNYEFPKEKGLMAGKYLVLITATNKTGQYIPDKYNISSTLTVDLSAGANDKSFALEPGVVTAPPVMPKEEGPPPPPAK